MESLITILQFAFTSVNSINPKELKFLFGSEEEKHEHELNKDNRIELKPEYQKSCVYCFETISVKYKNSIIFDFQFLVYINKTNNIIIDLDEVNRPSFELLFYSKKEIWNPTYLKYKNNEYHQVENYGNKYRTRIFFANIDPSKLQYINSEKINFEFLNNNTYQVFVRIYEAEKFEVSMTNMDSYCENNFAFFIQKYKLPEFELEEFEKSLNNFYDKYEKYMNPNSDLIKERSAAYSELEYLSKEIKEHKLYDFLDNPDNSEIENYTDEKILNLFHYDFSLNQFLKLKEDRDKLDERRSYALKLQSIEKQLYHKINLDHKLNINKKIKILKTITIFFTNSLLIDEKIFGANYINLKSISKDSPYYRSNEMLTKLISELTEESRLFEAFMYFDSKVIENILIKNNQKNYELENIYGQKIEIQQPEYITEYGMTLMTVDEIKQHLLDLLPTIIIQIDTTMNMRALYEEKTKIMVINELKMFGFLFTENEKDIFKIAPERYVVPISMEILHEMLSHGKLRYINKNDNSPLVIRDSKYDFKVQKLIKKIKLGFTNEIMVNKGETGRVLEHYISEDRNVIQKLKKRTINTDIINTKYWTGQNFNDLYKALDFDEKNGNVSKFTEEIILDDYDIGANFECVHH